MGWWRMDRVGYAPPQHTIQHHHSHLWFYLTNLQFLKDGI